MARGTRSTIQELQRECEVHFQDNLSVKLIPRYYLTIFNFKECANWISDQGREFINILGTMFPVTLHCVCTVDLGEVWLTRKIKKKRAQSLPKSGRRTNVRKMHFVAPVFWCPLMFDGESAPNACAVITDNCLIAANLDFAPIVLSAVFCYVFEPFKSLRTKCFSGGLSMSRYLLKLSGVTKLLVHIQSLCKPNLSWHTHSHFLVQWVYMDLRGNCWCCIHVQWNPSITDTFGEQCFIWDRVPGRYIAVGL